MSVTISTPSGSIVVDQPSKVDFSVTLPSDVVCDVSRTFVNIEVENSINSVTQ